MHNMLQPRPSARIAYAAADVFQAQRPLQQIARLCFRRKQCQSSQQINMQLEKIGVFSLRILAITWA